MNRITRAAASIVAATALTFSGVTVATAAEGSGDNSSTSDISSDTNQSSGDASSNLTNSSNSASSGATGALGTVWWLVGTAASIAITVGVYNFLADQGYVPKIKVPGM